MLNYTILAKTFKVTLWTIKENFETGLWVTFNQWLQRLEQQQIWTTKEKKKAKSYLETLLQTEGQLEGFLTCNIDFIISDLERKVAEKPDLQELWQQMLDWLIDKKSKGATQIVLDGQNRLKFSIKEFFNNNLALNLYVDNSFMKNVYFKDLDEDTKQQIKEHEVLLSVITNGDIESVVSTLIAINEGISWSEHEKRSVKLTPVSYAINRIQSEPSIVALHKKLKKIVFSDRKYGIEKKGDSRFIAEFLHYIRNSNIGSESSLDTLYNTEDEEIKNQIEYCETMFKWMAKYLTQNLINKIKSKERYRDLFIFTSMLNGSSHISPLGVMFGADDINYQIPLNQIQSPTSFLDKMITKINEMMADKSQFGIDPKTKKPSVKLCHPDSFYKHHGSSASSYLHGRILHFITPLNNIVKECIENGVIVETNPRKIDKFTQMQVEQKYLETGDIYERYPTDNLDSIDGKEIDHYVSVKNKGTNDIENLNYTSRKNNRRLGAK